MKWMIMLIVLAIGVYGVSFESAREAYVNATLNVYQLQKLGFPTPLFNDTLDEMSVSLHGTDPLKLYQTAVLLNESSEGRVLAEKYFAQLEEANKVGLRPNQNFSEVVDRAQKIAEMYAQAFVVKDAISAEELELGNVTGVNISAARVSFEAAKGAFASQRYDDALVSINETKLHLEEAQIAEARNRALGKLARRTIVGFVEDHTLGIIVFLFFAGLGIIWVSVELRFVRAVQKTRNIRAAQNACSQSILSAQKEYYGGHMGRQTYHAMLAAASDRARLLKVDRELWEKLVRKYRNTSVFGKFRHK